MRGNRWIEWTGTGLQPREREDLLATLTSDQKAQLRDHDYVWVEGVGVLWNDPDGEMPQRARFTHGTYFRTRRGEFYVDSEGGVRECSPPPRFDRALSAARWRARDTGS